MYKKGQSGNPSGKPKMTQEARDVIESCKLLSPAALEVIKEIMMNGENEKNRLTSALAIIERAWGKPMQPTLNEHTGDMTFTWKVGS